MQVHSVRARATVAVAAALVAMALSPAPAPAGTITTNCAGLSTAFANSNPSDVVVLTQMCTGMSFDLPDHRIVFRGQPGAGLDGTGAPQALLTGGNAIGTTVIRDLTFRDGTHGALDLGGAPKIINNRFINNTNPTGNAGAVGVDQDAPLGDGIVIRDNVFGGTTASTGNGADSSGGALYASSPHKITIVNNVFRHSTADNGAGAFISGETNASLVTMSGNSFSSGEAVTQGGAALILLAGTARLTNNVFKDNDAGPTQGAVGGGLSVQMGADSTLVQTNNRFLGNRVLGPNTDPQTGGGEYVINPNDATIRMTGDRFIGNAVTSELGQGGGLFIRQGDLIGVVNVALNNVVVAGNSVAANGQGGGIYALGNCAGVPCETNWALTNTTVVANTVGAGGGGSQLDGSAGNNLTVRNSIVYGNGSSTDVMGFDNPVYSFSDVCAAGGAPKPGTGNICKNPKLAKPAAGDVHQTRRSPTRDKGSNPLVPSTLKKDYEGDARIIDSDRNGTKRVDMGADERRAKPRITIGISRGSVIVSGAVAPNNKGRRVVVKLARLSGGSFKTIGKKRDRLNKRSRYQVRFADPAAGTCRATVTFLGSPTTFPGTKNKRFSC